MKNSISLFIDVDWRANHVNQFKSSTWLGISTDSVEEAKEMSYSYPLAQAQDDTRPRPLECLTPIFKIRNLKAYIAPTKESSKISN